MTITKMLRGMCIAASLFLFVAAPINGQTLSPILGLGTIQVLDNTGALATNAVLYFYAAGTSTQQATFTDSGGLTPNVNPLPLGLGARATVWLTSGQAYKIVGCLNNDGPTCSPQDVLFSQDNVIPGSASNSGTCATGCLGFLISSTASPATSGVLRCSSGDTCLAFRNATGSANLGLTKDTNDLLSWPTPLKFPENAGATGVAGFDLLWPDNSVHRWKMSNNGGSSVQVVASGNDIGTTDQVSSVHFSSTQVPFGNTAPTTNQCLVFNGTNLIGFNCEVAIAGNLLVTTAATGEQTSPFATPVFFLPSAHTLTRLGINIEVAASGCTGAAVIGLRDLTAASTVAGSTVTLATNQGLGNVDSGALSVSLTAAHLYAIQVTTAATGCGTSPQGKLWAVYQ